MVLYPFFVTAAVLLRCGGRFLIQIKAAGKV